MKQWIYECLGVLIKEPTEEVRKIVAETISSELGEKIADLEKQIEKMKICQNCEFEDNDYMEKPCCECSRCLGDIKRKDNTDKWKLKE